MNYRAEFDAALADPATFWQAYAQKLAWYKPPRSILTQDENGSASWFDENHYGRRSDEWRGGFDFNLSPH